MRTELKKVVWPTGKQIVNNVLWVIGLVVVVAAIVLVVDLVLKAADTKLWELISNWIG
ncbi:MAG: preprotein translocase subunit SecE [Clostridia bacterium]|nr:preprotein translocase subunit SecE [Clostridia bacterium]